MILMVTLLKTPAKDRNERFGRKGRNRTQPGPEAGQDLQAGRCLSSLPGALEPVERAGKLLLGLKQLVLGPSGPPGSPVLQGFLLCLSRCWVLPPPWHQQTLGRGWVAWGSSAPLVAVSTAVGWSSPSLAAAADAVPTCDCRPKAPRLRLQDGDSTPHPPLWKPSQDPSHP